MIGSTPASPQCFVPRSCVGFPLRLPISALALLLATGCGSSGGGGGPVNPGPTIVTAAFIGASSTPAAGETLLLFFSESVQAVSGKLLTDVDVTMSGSATLGTVTAPPVFASANSISITLGSGVSFVPDTTTITLSNDNDAIQDIAGKLGESATAVIIGTSDGQAPTLSNVTIAGIDDELNGTGSAGGTLQVPRNGWAIDLTFSDNGTIDIASTQITASVDVASTAGTQSAGVNLRPFLTLSSNTSTTASYAVPTTVTFPATDFTLTCTVADTSGLGSQAMTFSARARDFDDSLRPFETNVNASQIWYLDFSRDVESFTTSTISGGVSVDISSGANSRSDFEDILRVIGLNNTTPIANVSGSKNSNDVAQDNLKAELLVQLAALYQGANVSFTLTQPSGNFGGSSSLPYAAIGYSQISVAGSASIPMVLGVAIFDPSNTTQDDNTLTDYDGLRLGVFLHTIAEAGLGPPSSSAFRLTFGGLVPSLGGTPIGDDASDGARLLGTNTDSRATVITTAIDEFARFMAIIVAHECGHSMGLVENGAMPLGLYGEDSVNFPGSADGHIRNTSLFTGGSTNVMSPTLTYSSTIHPSSTFNSLNLAYLREQVFYGN